MARGGAVALTIDDGPTLEATPGLLRALADHDARASFFVSGERAERHPELVEAIVAAGHEVYPHGFEHQRFDTLTRPEIIRELQHTESILSRMRPTPSPYFIRLPHAAGHGSLRVNRAVRSWNRTAILVGWSITTDDWAIGRDDGDVDAGCRDAVAHVMASPHLDGAIVLTHDCPVDAPTGFDPRVPLTLMPQLVAALAAEGRPMVGLAQARAARQAA
jgi:peptidoglycan-N-acetylglucosamine deacetylase